MAAPASGLFPVCSRWQVHNKLSQDTNGQQHNSGSIHVDYLWLKLQILMWWLLKLRSPDLTFSTFPVSTLVTCMWSLELNCGIHHGSPLPTAMTNWGKVERLKIPAGGDTRAAPDRCWTNCSTAACTAASLLQKPSFNKTRFLLLRVKHSWLWNPAWEN